MSSFTISRRGALGGLGFLAPAAFGCATAQPGGRDVRPRVIVSTDIGGTDPDDFQSMAHLFVYADLFDLEGLISSPFGPGRAEHIYAVIDHYERDYASMSTWSSSYPTSDTLRAITKQGETEVAPYAGVRGATEGSRCIIECARREDTRPLHVLVWGGIEDLAQALHDAPDILPKLRVYFIGGPNKKWSVDAYHYVATNHRELWMIEANATYRGMFSGGEQDGEWGNAAFVARHVAGRGALGAFFAAQLGGVLKAGDTPSVCRLLRGAVENPGQESWGGRFVRACARPHAVFRRLTTRDDAIEQFGVLEVVLPLSGAPASPAATMAIENQSLAGFVDGAGAIRFRFSPKDAKTYAYVVRSNVADLDGARGEITAARPTSGANTRTTSEWSHWWTDDPDPQFVEGPDIGARTVGRWRGDILRDFASRIARCSYARAR